MWLDTLKKVWETKDVRKSLLFVVVMMVIFRIAANIPLPGIDAVALRNAVEGNQVFGLLNLFSGGTIRRFSVIAMGVAPYITASIIFQLLAMIIPRLDEIQKDGEAGQRRINQWTRLATVPLAIIQSFGLFALLRQARIPVLVETSLWHVVAIVCTVTAGTIFLMWIGELISEKKVGNGVSLLIFAGIVADLPTTLSQFFATSSSNWVTMALYAAVAIVTVLGVVFVTEGQRNIPVQYARQSYSGGGGSVASSLPLRVNMVGVIPIIFAISLLIFPTVIGQFLAQARNQWVANAASAFVAGFQNQWVYGILYFLLVVGFTYFYTAIVFRPEKVAENLQKQGGFIPGIRPGRPTADYVERIVNRITLGGSLFLGLIAVLPLIVEGASGTQTLALGGTSLLIVVSVVIESVKQIESQLTMHEYDVY